ncbi:hypothetical protein GJ496_006378 [Pomphorhynchus laevis]|nr:hypothetical protein GJ496_006378 [Pomphorhynchus laevis]
MIVSKFVTSRIFACFARFSSSNAAGPDTTVSAFKRAYLQYGKVLVYTHVLTTIGWIGTVSTAISFGLTLPSFVNQMRLYNIISEERSISLNESLQKFKVSSILRFLRIHRLTGDQSVANVDSYISPHLALNIATCYGFLKILSPIRYTVTITAAHYLVKRRRALGLMSTPPKGKDFAKIIKDRRLK